MKLVWRKRKPVIPVEKPYIKPPKMQKKSPKPKSYKVVGVVQQIEKSIYDNTTRYSIWIKTEAKKKGIDQNGNFAFQVSSAFSYAPLVVVGDIVVVVYQHVGYIDVEKFGVKLKNRDNKPNPDPTPDENEADGKLRMLPSPESNIEETPSSEEDRPQSRTGTRG